MPAVPIALRVARGPTPRSAWQLRGPYPGRLVIAAVLGLFLTGCSGRSRVELIPLNTRRLAPRVPLEFTFPAQRCYWWTDDNGKLWLAIRYHNLSLLGDWTRESFEMSMVLGDMPAEGDSQFIADRESVRALWHWGAYHLRMSTRSGVISLQRRPGNVVAGRFRLLCTSEAFGVLTGWERQSQVLLQGDFTAVENAAAGRTIVGQTEASQPRRPPRQQITTPPTTQPAG